LVFWKNRRLALWLGVGLIGCLVKGAPAQAAVTFNEKVPVTQVLLNPCNGELVTITGEQHLIIKETTDGAGGLHLDVFSSIHGEGLGNQGNSYVVSEQDHNTQNIQGSADHFETTMLVDTNLISRGSAPNFVSHALLHITFANGELRAFVDQFTEECRG
jgi:hypothetical protein